MKTLKILSTTLVLLISISILGTKTYAQTATAKEDNLKKMELKVAMTCNDCKESVGKCLAYEKGVKDFNIDMETKKVTITYNPDKTTADKIKASVAKLGYKTEYYTSSADCPSKAKCSPTTSKCCNKK